MQIQPVVALLRRCEVQAAFENSLDGALSVNTYEIERRTLPIVSLGKGEAIDDDMTCTCFECVVVVYYVCSLGMRSCLHNVVVILFQSFLTLLWIFFTAKSTSSTVALWY